MIEADLEVVRTKEVDLEVDRMTEVGLVEAVPTIGVVADSEVVPMIAAVIASQHAPITVAVSQQVWKAPSCCSGHDLTL
jgi:hypothetical protein